MKKFYRNLLWAALLAISLAGIVPAQLCAKTSDTQAASTTVGRMMEITEDTSAKTEALETAETIFELKKGDSIFVGSETEDGWYSVVKDAKTAFVQKDKVKELSPDPKLEEEMQKQADAAAKDVDLVNQYREEAAKSKIWGVVIVVLIVAIFALGIVITVQRKKGNQ